MTQVWSDQTVSFLIYLHVLCAAFKWQFFPVPAVIIASEMDPHERSHDEASLPN